MKRENMSVSSIGALKRLVQVLAETPLFSKGQVADEAISQAVDVLEDHDNRIEKLEKYVLRTSKDKLNGGVL